MITTGDSNIVQHPIWDILNEFEMPIVVYLRQMFRIDITKRFWKRFAVLGSASFITSMPTILFALGLVNHAKKFASALIFYALFSSFGKDLFQRRRPSTYKIIQSSPSTSTHSFPSRHTIGITLLACFTPYKYQLICFMALDRILMGKHFVTDCLFGYLIGELCVFLGTHIENMNFLLMILSIDMMIWNGAVKIMAETIPILMAPSFTQASIPLAYCIISLKFTTVYAIKKTYPKSEKAKKLIAEFFSSSLMIFIILQLNSFMQLSGGTVDVPNRPLYNSTSGTDIKKVEEPATSFTEEYINNFAEMSSLSSF